MSRIGGSFAPPISADTLSSYKGVAGSASPQVKEVMLKLCQMVEVFSQTPASTLPGAKHPSGTGTIVPLAEAEKERIWNMIPWDYECDAYQNLFDQIPTDSPVRNPAFHLLWFAKELCMDREPLTKDRL